MNLILEINGKAIERISIPETGITIGRSLDNDVIIKDRYVDAKQLKVTVDGDELLIDELNSTNGSEVDGVAIKGTDNRYSLGSAINIGDTILRLMDIGASVKKTVRRSYWFNLIRSFKPWPLMSLLVVFCGGLSVLKSWAFSTQGYNVADGFAEFFTIALGVVAIAACLAVFNKLIKGRSSIREYIILVSFVLFLSLILETIAMFIRFNLQQASVGEILPKIVSSVVLCLLMLGVLSYMTQWGRYKIWLVSVIFSCAILYSEYSDELSKEEYEKWSVYSSAENIMLPPAFQLTAPSTIDKHFEQSERLFKQAGKAQ